MSILTIFIQHSLEVLATTIREENEIKGIHIGKKEVKLILFCRQHESINRKLLSSSLNLVELQDTKVTNINFLHFYTLTMNHQKIKETIPFTIALKILNDLGINLLKAAKDLYSKTLKHWRNWGWHKQMERYSVLGLEETILLKLPYYPRWSTY